MAWVDNAPNGVVDDGEACDNNLVGCVACQPQYGYHCMYIFVIYSRYK